jgi:hypothetical protein
VTVYISEAHPDDEWQMESNRRDGFVHTQPKTLAEREALGRILVEKLKYRIPVVIDPLDGRAEKAFAAWPERIYVIGAGGTVLYKGGMGPFGFDTDEAEKRLAEILGSAG